MDLVAETVSRRTFLTGSAVAGLSLLSQSPASAAETINLGLPGGVDTRDLITNFPEKRTMILQRTRPPLLETPFDVFDKDVITPNDQFYVRWHWSDIPGQVDADAFRLQVHGQ